MQGLVRRLDQEQDRLFLWSPVFLAIGISIYFWLPVEPPLWIAVPLLVTSGVLAWSGRARVPNWGMIPLLLALGFSAAQIETARLATPMLKRDLGFADLAGTVDKIERLPNGQRITLADVTVTTKKISPAVDKVRLVDRKADADLQVGDQITTRGFLRSISEPLLPGDYDFRRNAFYNGLSATGYLTATIVITAQARPHLNFDRARQSLEAQIYETLQTDQAAISNALLTGDQTGISEGTLNAMRLSGLTHILSVSGLHIGLAASLFFFLVRALLAAVPAIALRYPIKKWAAVTAMAGATAYTIFAGAPVPAVRSLLMTGIALLAIMVDRSALSLRTVAVSALVILLIVPDALLGPSFQLSFAAITAIIAAYEGTDQWRATFRPQHFIVRGLVYVGAIAVTSLIASLATAPLTHYHFQQLSFYGVIANMLAVPLTSFWLMPAALLALFLLPFGLSHWPLLALGKGVGLLMTIAERTAQLPGADWAPANLPLPGVLCLMGGLLWLVIWETSWRWLAVMPLMIGIGLACVPAKPDLLLSNDGHYAALRSGDDYYLISDTGRRHADAFTPDQWRRWLGIASYLDGNEICDDLTCQLGSVTMVRDPNSFPAFCNKTSLQWLIYPAGRAGRCRQHTIEEPDLWRGGTITMDNDGSINRVQDHVGYRPWSVRSPYPVWN